MQKNIRYFFYAIFFITIVVVLKISASFLSAIFLAFLTASLTRPMYLSISQKLYNWLSKIKNSKIYTFFSKFLKSIYKGYIRTLNFLGKLPVLRLFKLNFSEETNKISDWPKIISINVAIFFTVGLILFLLLSSIAVLFLPTVKEVSDLSNTYFNEEQLIAFFNSLKSLANDIYPIEMNSTEMVQKVQEYLKPIITFLSDQLLKFTGTASDWVTNGIVYILFLIYLYPNYDYFIGLIKQLSPLPDDQDQQILDRIFDMVKATVVGTWVVAFIQAAITCVVFLLIGFEYSFFMGFLAFLLSLIPAVGPAVLTIPFAIYHYTTGDHIDYSYLLIGTTILNSLIDLLIRPVFTPKNVRLNTALFTLSVFGGLSYFGVIGLLYGPIIFIVFITIIELYFVHYKVD